MTYPIPQKPAEQAKIYGEALARLRTRARLNQSQAAERVGVGQPTWQRYEKGGNQAFLDVTIQRRCVEALGFTMDDFARELEGAAFNLPMTDSGRGPEPGAQALAPVNSLIFPLDGVVRASPKGFAVYDSEQPEDFDFGHVLDRNTRVLRVAGESMVPILEPGSFVTYDKKGVPKRNSLAVIRLNDGQYFVKKFIRMTDVAVECVEMEEVLHSGRSLYGEKPISYPLSEVKAVYPANVRMG